MNGWGFSVSTLGGMLSAIIMWVAFPHIEEYISFVVTSVTAAICMLIASLATNPTEKETLFKFYQKTRPPGFWGPIRRGIDSEILQGIDRENRRDFITAYCVSWPFQVSKTH